MKSKHLLFLALLCWLTACIIINVPGWFPSTSNTIAFLIAIAAGVRLGLIVLKKSDV